MKRFFGGSFQLVPSPGNDMCRQKCTPHFCGCLQEHFILPRFGPELSVDMTGYIKNPIRLYSLVRQDVERTILF